MPNPNDCLRPSEGIRPEFSPVVDATLFVYVWKKGNTVDRLVPMGWPTRFLWTHGPYFVESLSRCFSEFARRSRRIQLCCKCWKLLRTTICEVEFSQRNSVIKSYFTRFLPKSVLIRSFKYLRRPNKSAWD